MMPSNGERALLVRPPRVLNAAPAIPLHAFAAMAAFVLGIVQFAAPKGTLPHRTLGWIWVRADAGGRGQLVLDP